MTGTALAIYLAIVGIIAACMAVVAVLIWRAPLIDDEINDPDHLLDQWERMEGGDDEWLV